MVTRQMSLIMNHQIKIKQTVKVQPFVDHTEDTLRLDKNKENSFKINFFKVKMVKINHVDVFVQDV
jgi:hypothetical protein